MLRVKNSSPVLLWSNIEAAWERFCCGRLRPKRAEKSFVNTHALTTKEYPSRSVGTEPKISSTQNRTANIPEPVGTSSVRDIRSANNPHNVTASRIFADQHQFRDQGKSQKSLDRQNPPMTIDQVRDLLNKNK